MSNWDILDDNGGTGDEEVEYVGVIEEDEPAVQEPRRPRQNVRRVAPRRMPTDQTFYPVAQKKNHQNGVVGSPNRDFEDLVSYVDMPHGKQLGLTPEAIERLQTTPMTRLNGQVSQRIEPGTYVMYGPNRAEKMGMGTDPWSTEGQPGYQSADAAASAAYESQTSSGIGGWVDSLIGGIATFGSSVAESIAAGRISRREARTERLRIEAERQADADARDIAFQTAQLEHEENIARIEAQAEELETLRTQAEEAAALRRQAGSQAPVVGNTGTSGGSPVVWIIAGLLGLSAVGGVIYFVTRKKDDDED